MKTPWIEILERRKANIGFASKVGGLKPPTPAEKAAALSIEMASWQLSQSKKTWTVSSEYSFPLGTGINLKRTREPGGKMDGPEYNNAIHAYVVTPMDHYDILKAQGIDVSRWEQKSGFFQKLFGKINDLFMRQYNTKTEEPRFMIERIRLTDEFIEMFGIKEKK